jgi:hypothetical protein
MMMGTAPKASASYRRRELGLSPRTMSAKSERARRCAYSRSLLAWSTEQFTHLRAAHSKSSNICMVKTLPALPQQDCCSSCGTTLTARVSVTSQRLQGGIAHRGRDQHASTSHAGKTRCSGSLAVLMNVMLYSASAVTFAATSLRSW